MRANNQVPHYTVSCYFLLDPKNIFGVLFSETLCSSLTRRDKVSPTYETPDRITKSALNGSKHSLV